MSLSLHLRPSAARRMVWSRPDSRIVPFCSLCQKHIASDTVPLQLWDSKGASAYLCDDCVPQALESR
jgi:hypothetical protein